MTACLQTLQQEHKPGISKGKLPVKFCGAETTFNLPTATGTLHTCHLNGHFPGKTGLASSPLISPPTVPKRTFWDKNAGFLCHSYHPTDGVKSLKITQLTDPTRHNLLLTFPFLDSAN